MTAVSMVIVPGGLLLLAGLVVTQWRPLPESVAALLRVYPHVVFAAGIYFGWRFHRSQLLFGILILAVADRGLLLYGPGNAATASAGRTALQVAALLVPLNLAVLSVIAERGIVTFRGLLRLTIIVSQLILAVLLCQPEQANLAAWLERPLLNVPSLAPVSVAQPALIAFTMALGVVLIRLVQRPHGTEAAFAWTLLSVLFAFSTTRYETASTVYLATGGLILVLSVIETSYALAYRDELTGLKTRRALTEALLRLGGHYTVGMIDVDHFKQFNDLYGHDAGDQLLRMIAAKLGEVSGGGKAFRYGGEEFVVLFPGKSIQEAIRHLETLRKAVEAAPFALRDPTRPRRKPEGGSPSPSASQTVAVTISIGVAEQMDQDADPQAVIEAADQALYRAKAAGRNMISI